MIAEYKALAKTHSFVTIDAEQPIGEQHHTIRRLFREGEQKAWHVENVEAFAEWLRLKERRP